MLTQGVGTVSVSAPSDIGIGADSNIVGGDSFSGQEALLVRDYRKVLQEIDQVVSQVDRRPMQVAIEAMILSVKLNDSTQLGVNFELLRDNANARIISGTPLEDIAELNLTEGGLKVAFLDSNTSALIEALETVGETNVIATPRLMCLDKQRAEILIGAELGYVSTTQTETSTTQSVEFLEVGTQLRLRPFISSDGLIRMEVHPELSTGTVRIEQGFTLPDKEVTQVTTNIMVRDGCTVVIGGLMRDELTTTTSQIPLLGSLPVVGPVFRQEKETIERREIVVLVTPRIVYEPDTCAEGDCVAAEFHQRHAVVADQMCPFGTRYLGRKYFRLAQEAWEKGDQKEALHKVNLAIHFDPLLRVAIDLRRDIVAGEPVGEHTAGAQYRPPEAGWSSPEPPHPRDPGRPGPRQTIRQPESVR